MEYVETANVLNQSRRLKFPSIRWLNKSKFEHYLFNNIPIHPKLNSSTDINNNNNTSNDCIYVGKTITTNTREGARYGFDHGDINHRLVYLEIVGTVAKNSDNEWLLYVTHSNKVYEIKEDFLVLALENEHDYEWKNVFFNDLLVKHPLVGGQDLKRKENMYIGKASVENTGENVFGGVSFSDNCLHLAHNDRELAYKKFDLLCLKPSPASLKDLCRDMLRRHFDHSNEKINHLNAQNTLPHSLLNYVKYPSYMKRGDCLLKGEKLVSYDDSFELSLDHEGDLTYRPLKIGQKYLTCEYLFNCQDPLAMDVKNVHNFKKFISDNVDSVVFNRNYILFNKNDNKTYVYKSFYDQPVDYIFTFSIFTALHNFLTNSNYNTIELKRLKTTKTNIDYIETTYWSEKNNISIDRCNNHSNISKLKLD